MVIARKENPHTGSRVVEREMFCTEPFERFLWRYYILEEVRYPAWGTLWDRKGTTMTRALVVLNLKELQRMQARVGRPTKSGVDREKWEEPRRCKGEEVLVGLLTS